MSLEFHPLADLFPLIEGAEFDELVTSIKENGLREAIVTFDGKILDGRNRYRACLAAEVFPRLEIFDAGDPFRFVVDKNIHRRHLNPSQRAMLAADIAALQYGSNQWSGTGAAPTQAEAAEMLNISERTVRDAKKVLTNGTPSEIAAVKEGRVAAKTIANQIRAKLPKGDRKKEREASPSAKGKNPERIQRQQINAEVWGRVRDALVHLTSLPRPLEVVPIARASDRTGLVDARVLQALNWLEEFADGWTGNQVEARKARASS